MDNELLKNVDALAVNYISLKTLKRETMSKDNPIVKYYNDNIADNQAKQMEKLMETLLGSDIDTLRSGDLSSMSDLADRGGLLSNLYDNDLGYEMFEKYFDSNKNEVKLNNSTILEILEYSYKLYIELDKYDMSSDSNILPMVGMLFGNEINSDDIVSALKEDFTTSFNYIINHTDVYNEKIKHIKLKMLKEDLDKAVKAEKYMKAAEIHNKIKEIKKENL